MHAHYVPAAAFAIVAEVILVAGAIRWSNGDFARVSTLTFAVIVFQALLGMWTVTWLLKPIVVMGHLLGGLLTFSLLAWTAWRATDAPIRLAEARQLKRWVVLGLVLLGAQIALGGWTSANYAALACGNDFPKCVGQWIPPHDFHQGFVLWRGVGVDYEGGVLDGAARIAIQLAHRIGAGVVFAFVLLFAAKLLRTTGMRGFGTGLLLLVCAQAGLGIANVKLGLPLHVAVLHNAGAALLLFVLVTLLARLRPPET
jgi:cytochrome c oxidase assembly protein subunit 15